MGVVRAFCKECEEDMTAAHSEPLVFGECITFHCPMCGKVILIEIEAEPDERELALEGGGYY